MLIPVPLPAGALFLPPASLQLLVPPVRLMSAFVWRTIEQQQVLQYDKLLDFISLLTESVPELLSAGHKAQLLLGLRAKVTAACSTVCHRSGAGYGRYVDITEKKM